MSDTAGIRDSKDEIEEKGVKLAFKRAQDADLNIILLEPKSTDFTSFLKINVLFLFLFRKNKGRFKLSAR